MKQIEPHLIWIGHIGDARDVATILDNGIEVLVQLAIEETPVAVPRDLVSVRIPIYDGPNNNRSNLRLVIQVVADLIRRRRPTLVCCSAGMSRSPAIAAIALAIVERKDPMECLTAVRAFVPTDVSPGLWHDLVQLNSTATDCE